MTVYCSEIVIKEFFSVVSTEKDLQIPKFPSITVIFWATIEPILLRLERVK